MKTLLTYLFLLLLWSPFTTQAHAQRSVFIDNKPALQTDSHLMKQLKSHMVDNLADLPSSIRRVAFYRVNYSASLGLDETRIHFIQSEIEEVLKEYAGLTIVQARELEPSNEIKIYGKDDRLFISNAGGRSIAESTNELLLEAVAKNRLQSLIEMTVNKNPIEGYIVTLKAIAPESQEVQWVQSFSSYPVELRPERFNQFQLFMNAGVNIVRLDQEIIRATDTVIPLDNTLNEYFINFLLLQAANKSQNSLLGLQAGLVTQQGVDFDRLNATFANIGLMWKYALSKKNEDINNYRLMLDLGLNSLFPISRYKGSQFIFEPGLTVNITSSLSLGLHVRTIVSGSQLRNNRNGTFVEYNPISFGGKILVKL